MNTVTVSPKFQVVIPKSVRELAGIQPGQKLEVFRARRHHRRWFPSRALRRCAAACRDSEPKVDREERDRA